MPQFKQSLFIVASLLSGAFAGVRIEGFRDPTTCNSGVGGVTLNQDGVCVNFNSIFNAVKVAGGGSDSCFVKLYHGAGCEDDDFVQTNIGPINDPNLGGCLGPWNINGDSREFVASAKMINCPEP